MKKQSLIVITVIVLGMFGWAVYDLISSTDEAAVDNDNTTGNKITSPPADEADKPTESNEVGIARGEIAPDFKLKTLEGKTVRLSDYRGKRVIVNFWATWCPPCRAEIPDLQKLYNNKDVVILAVNLTETEDSKKRVNKFVKEYEMTFPVLMDVKSKVSTTYQVRAYPTSYMIDSNGRIQFKAMGAMNYELMLQFLQKME